MNMNYPQKNNFTRKEEDVKMKTDNNSYPDLNDEQKRNINSAYNAKKAGLFLKNNIRIILRKTA